MPAAFQALASHRTRRVVLAIAALVLASAGLLLPAPARAAGNPDITIAVDAQERALYGTASTVAFHASNPLAGPYGYNLSFRVVLPVGVSYAGGAGTPKEIPNSPAPGQTTLIWRNLSDLSPGSGYTLSFQVRHSYNADPALTPLTIGDTFAISGTAYIHDEARWVPKFDSAGNITTAGSPPVPSFTGSATGTDSTQITAVKIEKDAAGFAERELLRGIHDHQSEYSLKVTNNSVAPTETIVVDDYLPANLEFIDCAAIGSGDNTTSAPTNAGGSDPTEEYPGSGPIPDRGVTDCIQPSLVETIQVTGAPGDPDIPNGIYTHVQWSSLGDFAAGETRTIHYRAGIPLRANTMDWNGADAGLGTAPTAASREQAANLDNNSGTEATDEMALTNHATVSGLYSGTLAVEDETSLTQTAEDLAIHKTRTPGELGAGQLVRWTLRVRTSEYRSAESLVIRDEVPNGICPVDDIQNHSDQSSADDTTNCAPLSAGHAHAPSVPFTTVTERGAADGPLNGGFTVEWSGAAVPDLGSSADFTIAYSTRGRNHYQDNFNDAAPILAADSVSNKVRVDGTANVVCADGAASPNPFGCDPADPQRIEHDAGNTAITISDVSGASIAAPLPKIEKWVAARQPDQACPAATDATPGVWMDENAKPPFRPGDRVCWRLRIEYPSYVDTLNPTVTDFIPDTLRLDGTIMPGTGVVTSGITTAADDTFNSPNPTAVWQQNPAADPPSAYGGTLQWTLTAPTDTVRQGLLFHRVISTTVGPPGSTVLGELTGNLFKASSTNSDSRSTPLRDDAEFALSFPVLGADKRITHLDDAGQSLPAGVASARVHGGQKVTYRIRVSNTGPEPAETTEVWDRLPAGVVCGDVSNFRVGGNPVAATCDSSGTPHIVKWTWGSAGTPAVPAAAGATPGTADLTYDLIVPDGPRAIQTDQALVNTAGIREYTSGTNQPAPGDRFSYFPDDNIDPTVTTPNVVAPKTSATLLGAIPTITKSRATSLTATGNTNAQATIGETVTYTVSFTLPVGVVQPTLTVTDQINARHPYVTGTLARTAGNAAAIASAAVDGAGLLTIALVPDYTPANASEATFTYTFETQVADVASNTRVPTSSITNSATLTYPSWRDGAPSVPTNVTTPNTSTQIVEPQIGTSKTSNAGANVNGGDIITYTIGAQNGANADRRSPAYDTTLVDLVPGGLTPLKTGSTDSVTADGDIVDNGGVWSETNRTISYTTTQLPGLAVQNPGTAAVTTTYRARVNDPAVGGALLTNTVTARTSSMPGTVTGERTSASTTNTGYISTSSNTLDVAASSITKTSDTTTRTPGQLVQYTLTVTVPLNANHYDVTVKDTLPNSLDFVSYDSMSCTSGCVTPGPGPDAASFFPYGSHVQADGTTNLAWNIGDLGASSAARVFEFKYTARVRKTQNTAAPQPDVVAGDTIVNNGSVNSNRTNNPGFTPGPEAGGLLPPPAPAGPFDDSDNDTRTVTVQEPTPTLDKQIAVGAGGTCSNTNVNVVDGNTLKYCIVVGNSGTSTLYDVAVADQPAANLTGVTMAAGNSTTWNSDPWAAPGDDIKWTIPSIPAGGSVTLTYTASLPAVTTIGQGDTFVNTATVTSSWGVPSADRTPDDTPYRSYTTPNDSTTATFHSPQLTLQKTTGVAATPPATGFLDNAPAEVGKAFTWRIVVGNTSTVSTATNIRIADTLPADWDYVPGSASITGGGDPIGDPSITADPTPGDTSGDGLTWATALSLAPGQTRVLTFQATPTLASATSIGNGAGAQHVNVAALSAGNDAGNPADKNSPFAPPNDTASANLILPDIAIAKTPDGGTGLFGAVVPFTITVTNNGTVEATNVRVSDTFPTSPSALTYTPGAATALPAAGFTEVSGSATAAEWRIATLAAGASVAITVPLQSDANATHAGSITNTAAATSDQTVTPVTDPGDVTLTTSADLVAEKTSTPAAATAGATLTYHLKVTNNGPSVARSVAISDVMPAEVAVDTAQLPAECGYVAATTTVSCAIAAPGTLAPGASKTWDIITTIDSGFAAGNITNTVIATSTTTDPVPGNNSSTVVTPVGTVVDLQVTKTAASATVLNEQNIAYELVVRNNGPSNATGVELVDTLPAGLTYVSDDRSCAVTGQVISCAVGSLANGASTTVNVVAQANTLGAQTNTATVSGNEPDPVLPNNEDTATVTVLPAADLAIEKTGPGTVAPDGNVTYDLEVTNNGPDPATGVRITDALPAGLTFLSADAGCVATGQNVECAIGNLAVGASETRSITAKAAIAAATQTLINTATVTGNEGDPVLPNNEDSSPTTVGPAADLSITQDAAPEVTAGGNTTFTIVAKNEGPATGTGVIVRAPLPDGVSIIDIQTAQGTCRQEGQTVICELGNLPVGDTVLITIGVHVPEALAGTDLRMTATIEGDLPELRMDNNSAPTVVRVVAKPITRASVTLTKTAAGIARAGQPLTYTITASNAGPAAARDVVIIDALDANVTFRSATPTAGTCEHTSGTVRCAVGTVASGASASVRLVVVPTGNGRLENHASFQSSTTDIDLGDNRGVATTQVQPARRTSLRITKTPHKRSLVAGDRVNYKIVVRNTGKSTAYALEICDTLPKHLTLRSTKGGKLRKGKLCFTRARLGAGKRAVFTVRAKATSRAKGKLVNRVSVTASNAKTRRTRATVNVKSQGAVNDARAGGFTG